MAGSYNAMFEPGQKVMIFILSGKKLY